MEEISNKTLAILLICAIVVSLGGTLLSLNKLQQPGGSQITGMATNSSYGIAEVTIQAITQIGFNQNAINFGAGYVNDTCEYCQMAVTDGVGSNNGGCCLDDSGAGWTDTSNYDEPLILENQGNFNVSLTIQADKNASEWINGTGPLALFRILSGNESTSVDLIANYLDDTQNSCETATGWANTTWSNLTTDKSYLCGSVSEYGFLFQGDRDQVQIQINVTIPRDSIKGKTNVSITLEATSE
jgi:hypothetical protein